MVTIYERIRECSFYHIPVYRTEGVLMTPTKTSYIPKLLKTI